MRPEGADLQFDSFSAVINFGPDLRYKHNHFTLSGFEKRLEDRLRNISE